MKNGMTAIVLSATVALSACAEKSSNISAAYVSPMMYQNLSCRQISEEANRVSSRASQVMGAQDKKASNDATATAVGMVLFWPALFFIKGDSETSAEVSRLKGEMEALEQASIRKNCGIVFKKAPPKEEPKKKKEVERKNFNNP
ncbi:hypothetical protein LX70_02161 [Defluviimonas denitrificans]|uniref:Lipoprotein n=1 Tax=Albidovulum denitrificans TaxID=404881 RepID=A0A2S8S702_9RHOB|nr:hypothetical protein [Defluviimonas denitrificans]PQV56589.1 hypothetical protein LX70_02161 [Defluviimonas denitrificans]